MNWKGLGRKLSWPKFEVLFRRSPGGTLKKPRITSVRIACLRAEVLTLDLMNTKQEC
jgi:hypothetical protein